jgi:hypothetical protein
MYICASRDSISVDWNILATSIKKLLIEFCTNQYAADVSARVAYVALGGNSNLQKRT